MPIIGRGRSPVSIRRGGDGIPAIQVWHNGHCLFDGTTPASVLGVARAVIEFARGIGVVGAGGVVEGIAAGQVAISAAGGALVTAGGTPVGEAAAVVSLPVSAGGALIAEAVVSGVARADVDVISGSGSAGTRLEAFIEGVAAALVGLPTAVGSAWVASTLLGGTRASFAVQSGAGMASGVARAVGGSSAVMSMVSSAGVATGRGRAVGGVSASFAVSAGAGTASGRDYGLGPWLGALDAPGVKPRMLVIADSLTEAMGNTGPVKGWPYQLRPSAQTVFIPPIASWGGTYNARQYQIGTSVVPHLTPEPIRTSPSTIQSWWTTCANATPASGSYTYLAAHVAGLSNIRVLFTSGPNGWLDYKWGSASDARLSNVRTWHGDVKIADVPAGTGALQFNYSGENYTIIGILGDIGTPDIEVMNLSRSGAMVTNWNEWMADGFKTTNTVTGIPANLARGFDPHLVQIASGGNEYWQSMPTETFKQNYRDLIDRLIVLCPNAGFLITNQPPGNVADTPLAQWDRIQNATAEVASEYEIPVVDWRNLIPSPENDNAGFYATNAPDVRPPTGGWYSGDGVHPTDEGSRYAADLARDMLGLSSDGVWFVDDFNRANGDLGSNWVHRNSTGAPQISSNQVIMPTAPAAGIYDATWTTPCLTEDQFVEITCVTSTNADSGILLRGTAAGACVKLVWWSGVIQILHQTGWNGTGFTSGGTSTVSVSVVGKRLRLTAEGNVYTAYLDGVQVSQWVDTANVIPLTGRLGGIYTRRVSSTRSGSMDAWAFGDLYA